MRVQRHRHIEVDMKQNIFMTKQYIASYSCINEDNLVVTHESAARVTNTATVLVSQDVRQSGRCKSKMSAFHQQSTLTGISAPTRGPFQSFQLCFGIIQLSATVSNVF